VIIKEGVMWMVIMVGRKRKRIGEEGGRRGGEIVKNIEK